MAKIPQSSSWNDEPTPDQVRYITRRCAQLGITEPLENMPSNRYEARALQYELMNRRQDGKNRRGKI